MINKGLTVCAKSGNTEFNSGYFVALANFGQKIKKEDLNLQTVIKYVTEHTEELQKQGKYFGLFIDDELACLDVSVLVTNKRQALELAYLNGQRAIYDNANKEVIILPTPQTSGTSTQQRAYITQAIDKLCKI